MKLLIVIFLTLAGSFWLGLRIVDDPGLIVFAYQSQTIEMPLWFGACLLLVGFIVFYALLRLLSTLLNMPSRLRHWHQQQKMIHDYERVARGLLDLNQGEWQKAQRQFLTTSPQNASLAAINLLGAAKAAQEAGDGIRRNELLAQAEHDNPKAALSIQLTKAGFEIDAGELPAALDTLLALKQRYPRHPQVIRYLKDLYLTMSEWEPLTDLLPTLKRYRLIPKAEQEALEITAYRGLIEEKIERLSFERVKKIWQRFPYHVQTHPLVLIEYVRCLLKHNEHQEAESLLYHALQNHHDDDLTRLYGLCVTDHPHKHLARAEAMLKKDPSNAVLLLTLGRLAKQNQLWGKARSYLENSIYHAPMPETYQEMASLLDQLGENQLAREYYRQGLSVSLQHDVGILEDKT